MTDRKLPDDVTRCNGRITTNPTGFGTISVGQAECLRCLRSPCDYSAAAPGHGSSPAASAAHARAVRLSMRTGLPVL